MDNFVEKMLSEFERGKISRRQLIQTLAIAATAVGAGETLLAEPAAPATLGFHTICVNHISYSVAGKDYGVARDFYVKLFGMDYPPDQDTGGQAYMPFGPREAGTFMLPRGGRDPNAGPAPERGARGEGAAGGGDGRGAGGGGGRGAGGAAARGNAQGNRGGGGAPRPPLTVVVDQFGLTVANFDAKKTEEALKKMGLDPKKDGDSFRVVDPFGMELTVSGPKVSAY
jgi:hypothetical protein